MFLSEMTRHVGNEENTMNVTSMYSRSGTTWGTIHSYGSINPATPGIYLVRYQLSATDNTAEIRIKVGSRYIHGAMQGTGTLTVQGVCYLPAGSQTVIAEHRHSSSIGSGRIQNFQLGRIEFSDVDAEALQTYASGLTLNVPTRPLPLGSIKQVCVMVNCWAYTSGAQTNFENIGDALTNGVSLTIEGSQVDWTERKQDTVGRENAWANYFGVAGPGQDIAVSITKDNANTVVHVCVVACPWILPGTSTFEPMTLTIPQGSTIYLMLEPMHLNPTKTIKIGTVRAITFGDTTDFYSTSSGTNILTYNYTFQEVKNGAVLLYTYGLGGCIASIGVDIR
jgi:hypothetical protein